MIQSIVVDKECQTFSDIVNRNDHHLEQRARDHSLFVYRFFHILCLSFALVIGMRYGSRTHL